MTETRTIKVGVKQRDNYKEEERERERERAHSRFSLTVPGLVKSTLCDALCLIWPLNRRTHTLCRYSRDICEKHHKPLELSLCYLEAL